MTAREAGRAWADAERRSFAEAGVADEVVARATWVRFEWTAALAAARIFGVSPEDIAREAAERWAEIQRGK